MIKNLWSYYCVVRWAKKVWCVCVCFESDGHFLNFLTAMGTFWKLFNSGTVALKSFSRQCIKVLEKYCVVRWAKEFFSLYMPFIGEEGLNNFDVVIVLFLAVFLSPPSYLRRPSVLWCNEWFYRIKSEDQKFWHILISPCVNFYNVRTMWTVNLIVKIAGERKAKRAWIFIGFSFFFRCNKFWLIFY